MNAPKLVVFVRHGESHWNAAAADAQKEGLSDLELVSRATEIASGRDPEGRAAFNWGLSPRGYTQAAAAAERIAEQFPDGFDVHYASRLRRAMQTLPVIAPRAGATYTPMLNEFRMWQCACECNDRKPFPREGLAHDLTRMHLFFNWLHARERGQRVLVVGHGNWITAAMRYPYQRVYVPPRLQIRHVRNASLTIFQYDYLLERLSLVDYDIAPAPGNGSTS